MKKHICTFPLPEIFSLETINGIVATGYRRTGCKFWITFQGSKGYLSNIQIDCEGTQKERNNRIWVENLRNEDRSLMSKVVSIYHSDQHGIIIEITD